MLKHVSSSNLSPYKVQRCLARDTVSLSSSLSFGSSGAQEPLSSRSSSTSSLHDVLAQRPPKISDKVKNHWKYGVNENFACNHGLRFMSSYNCFYIYKLMETITDIVITAFFLQFAVFILAGAFHLLSGKNRKLRERLSEKVLFLMTGWVELFGYPVLPCWCTIKVYTKVLCADMEYKTLCISQQTTSKDIVRMLLSKFKMKHRDPNLFYLTMEVWMRKTGIPIRSVVVLEDEAHPAELQACHPRGESKFSMKMRRGGLVKVFGGSCLMAGSLYKSLLVSERTCVSELIQLVLHCYNSTESHEKFSLYEVCFIKDYERRLHPSEFPLQIQLEWPSSEHFAFQLRRNVEGVQRRLPWLRSPDSSGKTNIGWMYRRSSIGLHSLSESDDTFNTYENCFYI